MNPDDEWSGATTTTTVVTVPTTMPQVTRPTNLGLFTPGWDSRSPSWVAMAQTYVNVDSLYLWHRISQMNGRPCFVYVETTGYSIVDTIDGTLDAAWSDIISQVPSYCYFAPIAEMNGTWTTYHGTPWQAGQAYARISRLYPGSKMCGSFSIMRGSAAYLAEVAPYVDVACPSHYDMNGSLSGATVARQAEAHAASAGLPLILAQTGTVQADKVGWAIEVANATRAIVIYFDQHAFATGGWPW